MASTDNTSSYAESVNNTIDASRFFTETDLFRQLCSFPSASGGASGAKQQENKHRSPGEAGGQIPVLDSKDLEQAKKELKLYCKMWSAFTKFIRVQCNKDRTVDSSLFGIFYRTFQGEHINNDNNGKFPQYSCTGGGLKILDAFKLHINNQSAVKIPIEVSFDHVDSSLVQHLKNRELVCPNFQAIAEVCRCRPEQLSSFLNKVKDQILFTCLTKKRSVCLNLAVGQMWFYPSMNAEFKSLQLNEIIDTMYKHEIESTVSGGTGRGGHFKLKGARGPKQSKLIQQAIEKKRESANQNFNFLSSFLQTQFQTEPSQLSNFSKTAQSTSVKKSLKYNNQLIEKAKREIDARKSLIMKSSGPVIKENEPLKAGSVVAEVTSQLSHNRRPSHEGDRRSVISH